MADDNHVRRQCNDPGPHLDDDLCLDFVTGLLKNEERSVAADHLDGCRECEAKMQAIFGDRFLAESKWAEGEGLGQAVTVGAGPRRDGAARRFPFYPVAAGLLVAALLLLLFWPREPVHQPQDLAIVQVRTLLEQRPSTGLVLVGAAPTIWSRSTERRGGGHPDDAALMDALEVLQDRQRRNETNADQAYWIAAGCTELGQLSRARALLPSIGSTEVPETRWLVLAAEIARRDSRLDRARRLLELARLQDPDSPVVAFNLGLVLHDQGDVDAARPYLQAAQEVAAGTPLGGRAAELLESAVPTGR